MAFKEKDNSSAFEDIEAFKKINIKHNQKYIDDYKKCVKKEASLLHYRLLRLLVSVPTRRYSETYLSLEVL